jgi:predicted aspartyl protease
MSIALNVIGAMIFGVNCRRPPILSVIAVCAALAASPAHGRCRIANVAALPVEIDTNQLLTRGAIDGKPVRVLIDTGSNMSLIWRSAAERLGLRLIGAPHMRLFGLGGESRVDATFVDELQVQSFKVKDLRIAVAGDRPGDIDFIFGEDFLGSHSVEFDLSHGVVRTMETAGCTPAELPYWSKTYSMADLVASPRDLRAIRVDVLLNGHAVRAQLDSGSSATLLAKSVADFAGVRYVSAGAEVVGIGERSIRTWVADVRSFKLGDESINNSQLRVAQLGKYQTMERIGSRIRVPTGTEPEMVLGMDFLRAHRILIDNTTRKMVFTYEGGPVFQIGKPARHNEASSQTARFLSVGN